MAQTEKGVVLIIYFKKERGNLFKLAGPEHSDPEALQEENTPAAPSGKVIDLTEARAAGKKSLDEIREEEKAQKCQGRPKRAKDRTEPGPRCSGQSRQKLFLPF